MAVDPRKKAKQLARKAAKRKAQLAKKYTAGTGMEGSFASWPIHECYAYGNLFEIGIGNVFISRKLGNQIAVGIFLVDTGCLGVKNAILRISSQFEFQDLIDRFRERENLIQVKAEYARKLIEDALEYAAELGFKPHKDYHKAKKLFGAIDTSLCDDSFEFGKDGKPFYGSGPSDSPGRIAQIVDMLLKRCGPDGFHCMICSDGLDFDDDFDDDFDFDDDDDELYEEETDAREE
jgi:hypothetical protein